jgi:hypothetical protein
MYSKRMFCNMFLRQGSEGIPTSHILVAYKVCCMFNLAQYFVGFVENILSIIENNFTSIYGKINPIYGLLILVLCHLSCFDIK